MEKSQKTLDFLKANPAYLRICVQYETLNKDVPIFLSFRNFCQRLGSDVMDYPEFEFWYWRFYHGETDLDVDRSAVQPKTTISDLPVEIIGMFVDELAPVDRILFRQTSTQLQSIVDGQRLEIQDFEDPISFNWETSSATITGYPFGSITFGKLQNGYFIEKGWHDSVTIQNSSYLDGVQSGFLTVFGAPRVKIHKLKVNYETNKAESHKNWEILMGNLQKFLEISKRKIHVQELVFNASDAKKPAPDLLLSMLPLIEGLENLKILSRHREICYSKLAELDQWKQAKTIKLISVDGHGGYCDYIEIKHFSHFDQFNVTVDGLTVKKFAEYVKELTKSETFKKCTISGSFTFTALDYATASNNKLQADKTVREPIKNSDEYLELKFYIDYSDGRVVIERKKDEKKEVVKKEKPVVEKKKKARSVSAARKKIQFRGVFEYFSFFCDFLTFYYLIFKKIIFKKHKKFIPSCKLKKKDTFMVDQKLEFLS